jgi:hypothetical protein
MIRHYDTLLEEDRGQFHVIVDKTWEDLDPVDLFDTSIDPDTGRPYYDMDEIYSKINDGSLEWFMLRCRVFFEGVELADDYIGGFLYEDAREILTDGTAEDMIQDTIDRAKTAAREMKQKFAELEVDAA